MTPTPRRWFQFSLRTMFVAVTLLAIPCTYVAYEARIVAHRKATLEKIVLRGANWHGPIPGVITPPSMPQRHVPWIRKLLGDPDVEAIAVPEAFSQPELDEIAAEFPEANVFYQAIFPD